MTPQSLSPLAPIAASLPEPATAQRATAKPSRLAYLITAMIALKLLALGAILLCPPEILAALFSLGN